MHSLASQLIPREIFTLKGRRGSQLLVVVDTKLLSVVPCEINNLPDLCADLRYFQAS